MSRITGRATRVAIATSLALAAVGASAGSVAFAGTAPRASKGADLGISNAYVAGGAKFAELGQSLTFVFTAKDFGPAAGDVTINLVTAQGLSRNAPSASLSCVLPNGAVINPDGDNCEPGSITAQHSAGSLVFTARANGKANVVVKVCVGDLSGTNDPNDANDCRTLRVTTQ